MTTSPDPVDVEIGKRLRARREQLNYNQSQLGRAIGVTFQQVQKYEKGTNRVSGSMMFRMAAFLGVDPAFFFPTARTDIVENDPVAKLLSVPEGLELAQLFPQLKPDCQRSVLSIVRAMAMPSMTTIAAAIGAA